MNQITIAGRIQEIKELRKSQNDKSFIRFVVCARKARQATKEDGYTFFDCVAFGRDAEFINEYMEKGTHVCVFGSIDSRKYESKSGEMVTAYGVTVDNIRKMESVREDSKPKTAAKAKEPDPFED